MHTIIIFCFEYTLVSYLKHARIFELCVLTFDWYEIIVLGFIITWKLLHPGMIAEWKYSSIPYALD
jgi:hypothetical protein